MPNDSEEMKFEREKFQEDVRLREAELKLRTREVEKAEQPTGWTSPLVIAVIAATVAALGNAAAVLLNGHSQRELENEKATLQLQVETTKAEFGLIQSAIGTSGDQDQSKKNLQFLLDAKLINDKQRISNLSSFLANVKRNNLPTTSSGTTSLFPNINRGYRLSCRMENRDLKAVADAVENALRSPPLGLNPTTAMVDNTYRISAEGLLADNHYASIDIAVLNGRLEAHTLLREELGTTANMKEDAMFAGRVLNQILQHFGPSVASLFCQQLAKDLVEKGHP